jgi:hypothetical protein
MADNEGVTWPPLEPVKEALWDSSHAADVRIPFVAVKGGAFATWKSPMGPDDAEACPDPLEHEAEDA